MRNAPRLLLACLIVSAAGACHNRAQQAADSNQLAFNNASAPPPDIEALPPDESSATPSNQLLNGDDSPDVNDTAANSSD